MTSATPVSAPGPRATGPLGASLAAAEAAVMAKVTKRLIPFLFILYILAYLDRVNVGFVKLHLKDEGWLTDPVYGIGAGIFFLGYFLFEIPSNLIMERVGARVWIARIMIIWGVLAAAMAFVNGAAMFYVMRFLLGLGEAGFFPGIILYLTYWYPAKERARAISLFMTATAVANIFGGPVSGLLLGLNGFLGVKGWQWLFVLEGIPASLMGFVVLFYLTDRPEKAQWLTPAERTVLIERLAREKGPTSHHVHSTLSALLDPKVLLFCLIYFCTNCGAYGITMWLPQIVKDFKGLSDFQVGLITAIPYIFAGIFMVWVGRHSDQTGERRLHVAGPMLMASIGLGLSAYFRQPALALASLVLAQMGLSGYLGAFWALPTAYLSATAAAGGIAMINSVGNLGGYAGPAAMGFIKEQSGGYSAPLYLLSGILLVGALLVFFGLRQQGRTQGTGAAGELSPVTVGAE